MRRLLLAVPLLALAALPAGAAEPKFPADVQWVAESLAGKAFAPVSRPTLRIAPDGRASGTAGCNRYMGTASLSGASLGFGGLAMTKMACFGAGGENESRFAPALGSARSWRMEKRSLIIETANGPLRFRRR